MFSPKLLSLLLGLKYGFCTSRDASVLISEFPEMLPNSFFGKLI